MLYDITLHDVIVIISVETALTYTFRFVDLHCCMCVLVLSY